MKLKIIFILFFLSICATCWSQDRIASKPERISISDQRCGCVNTKDSLNSVQEGEKHQKIYNVVSQMPSFPGGFEALMKFMADSLKIRIPPEEGGILSRVVVRFVIDTIGDIQDITILKSLSPTYDKDAIRMIKSMPRWIPGEENGVKVPVYFNLPILHRYKH